MNKLFDVSVLNLQQLCIVKQFNINKIYIPFDLFYEDKSTIGILEEIHNIGNTQVYLSLPEIIRKKDEQYLNTLKEFLNVGKADGILVKNLEEIELLYETEEELNNHYISLNGKNEDFTSLYIDSDSSIYTWNISASEFVKKYCSKLTAPLELSFYELKDLKNTDMIIPIYGHVPLMKSVNCIKKTSGNCDHKADFIYEFGLKDRKNITTPVISNCVHCYNIIYNAIPTSLHKYFDDLLKCGYSEFRLDFTIESTSTVKKIMDYYFSNENRAFPLDKYTGGHIQKGAI